MVGNETEFLWDFEITLNTRPRYSPFQLVYVYANPVPIHNLCLLHAAILTLKITVESGKKYLKART